MSRRAKPHRPEATPHSADQPDHSERLQKLLAAAGLGSRRQCEELIQTGRVEVDRKVVTELGSKADPRRQEIRVDGVALPRPKLVHYMLNKPAGIVSTNRDPSGRPRVIDLIPGGGRLFPVGRLDMSSEGLILLTNDGDLANRLAHPRYGIEKTYHVEVAGTIEKEDLDKLRKGVYLAEGFAKVKHVKVKTQYKKSTLLEVVLDEGRNREIRRLLARIGHKVMRLKRVALGPLRLGELEPSGYRPLTHDELRDLRQATTPEGRRQRRKVRAAADASHQREPRPAAKTPAAEKMSAGGKPNAGGEKTVGGARPRHAKSGGAKAPEPHRATIIGGGDSRPARKLQDDAAVRPPRKAQSGPAGRPARKPKPGVTSRPARKPRSRTGAPAFRQERRK